MKKCDICLPPLSLSLLLSPLSSLSPSQIILFPLSCLMYMYVYTHIVRPHSEVDTEDTNLCTIDSRHVTVTL